MEQVPETMTLLELIETMYKRIEKNMDPHNPAIWIDLVKQMTVSTDMGIPEDPQWPLLLKCLQAIMSSWQTASESWAISSLTMLMEKISSEHGDISQMSFNMKLMNHAIKLFGFLVTMAVHVGMECLDSVSKKTTSTLSTTVPSVDNIAETSGGVKLNLLESLDQLVPRTNQYGNLRQPTGSMSSSISFLRNGELEKFGLEEKVGKHRLTVGRCEYSFRSNNTNISLIAQLVRWEEEFNARRPLVRRKRSWDNMLGQRQSDDENGRRINKTHHNEIHGKRARTAGKFGYIKSQTKALLLKYYVTPLSAIREMKEFRDDIILSDPKNKDYIQASFDDFGKDINSMSLRDIYNILTKDTAEPIFFMSMNYGTMDESLDIIDQLLNWQFDNDEDKICEFLNTCVNIIDKRLSKMNTLSVLSPPSAGKNYFFDMIFAIIINYGQLGQANRHNVFAFQEAPNKRLILWNEPNYESAMTDTLKLMFAGDPFTVRVKHQLDVHVLRTPVIVLTNNRVKFLNDPAFNDRIAKYEWKAAPFLKAIDFKPHPMTFFNVLLKYNISFE